MFSLEVFRLLGPNNVRRHALWSCKVFGLGSLLGWFVGEPLGEFSLNEQRFFFEMNEFKWEGNSTLTRVSVLLGFCTLAKACEGNRVGWAFFGFAKAFREGKLKRQDTAGLKQRPEKCIIYSGRSLQSDVQSLHLCIQISFFSHVKFVHKNLVGSLIKKGLPRRLREGNREGIRGPSQANSSFASCIVSCSKIAPSSTSSSSSSISSTLFGVGLGYFYNLMFAGVFFVLALLCFRHLPGCGSGFKVPGFAVEVPLGKLLPDTKTCTKKVREGCREGFLKYMSYREGTLCIKCSSTKAPRRHSRRYSFSVWALNNQKKTMLKWGSFGGDSRACFWVC